MLKEQCRILKIKEWNIVSPCWVVGFYFWVVFLICTSKDSALSRWFASIELGVCKQSILSRGVFPGEVLLDVLFCIVAIHILETGLCVAVFLPFCSSHWETPFLEYAVLPRWFLSAWRDPDPWYFAVVSGGDIYQGSAQLLQLAHVVFIRAPSISNLRHTDVLQCITV